MNGLAAASANARHERRLWNDEMERLVNPRDLGLTIPDGQRLTEGEAIKRLKARAEAAEAAMDKLADDNIRLVHELAALRAQLAAAQPAIEAWAQHEADNERRTQLQEEMIAEGLIKRPFWEQAEGDKG